MGVMTSDPFHIVGRRTQILVHRVEEEGLSPKVREFLCEVSPFFTAVGHIVRTLGWVREGEGLLSTRIQRMRDR